MAINSSTNGAGAKRVGIFIENQVEDAEFLIPYNALKQAGVHVTVIGSRINDKYKGKRGKVSVQPNATATEVRAEDFDALVIPGGVAPDHIRVNPSAVALVAEAIDQGKLIAAVCHGPQVLIEADRLRGKRATGFRAIRKDMENAGATYLDEPVVVDGGLITSRQPGDLALFAAMILSQLGLADSESFPSIDDYNFEWWKLAEKWGGSSESEITNALKTAATGEYYTLEAFQGYHERVADPLIRALLSDIITTKRQNIELLEARLAMFDETVSWQAAAGKAYAALQDWLQSDRHETEILRRALGDLQTGMFDAAHLSSQVTDPISAGLLGEIQQKLAQFEPQLADLYRSRMGATLKPPMPTTVPAT